MWNVPRCCKGTKNLYVAVLFTPDTSQVAANFFLIVSNIFIFRIGLLTAYSKSRAYHEATYALDLRMYLSYLLARYLNLLMMMMMK